MCHSKILDSFCAEHKSGRREDPAMPGRREVKGVAVLRLFFSNIDNSLCAEHKNRREDPVTLGRREVKAVTA
jgi:hypothetical protein